MKLSLRQLQVFLAVAESGSTVAASEVVSLSQSATSAALNELEHVLSHQLFDRIGKRLMLNDNGRLLLPQARLLLDTASSVEQLFTEGDDRWSGIRIGASMTIGSYCLPALLADSQRERSSARQQADLPDYPQLYIANTTEVVSAVAGYAVDCGFIEGACHDTELSVEPWLEDEMVIVCAPDHALATRNHGRVTYQDLQSARWLLREPGSGTREHVEQMLLPHFSSLKVAGEFGNPETIKHAAAAGLGLACISRIVVEDLLALGRLCELQTELPALRRHFYLVYHRHKLLSPRLQHFLRYCREWV